MVKIKYIGPGFRVVAGKHMMQGEEREIGEKMAETLRGDENIVFLDAAPAAPVDPAPEAETEVITRAPMGITPPVIVKEPKPTRKTKRSKKK